MDERETRDLEREVDRERKELMERRMRDDEREDDDDELKVCIEEQKRKYEDLKNNDAKISDNILIAEYDNCNTVKRGEKWQQSIHWRKNGFRSQKH